MTDDLHAQLAAATWRKASSSGGSGACVEVARLAGGTTAVRDSKDPGGAVLAFTPAEWDTVVGGVKAGEFDDWRGGC